MSTAIKRYTYADLLDTPDDGNRYEIIDGELIVSAAPFERHQRFLYLLSRRFGDHVDRHRLGRIYFAPVDVMLPSGDTVQPDLIFIRRDRLYIYEERVVNGPPDSLTEVLSPSTRDRDLGIKRAVYEMFGVREYWIADPDTPSLTLLALGPDGKYSPVEPVNGVLHSRVISGFAIDLEDLFAEFAAD